MRKVRVIGALVALFLLVSTAWAQNPVLLAFKQKETGHPVNSEISVTYNKFEKVYNIDSEINQISGDETNSVFLSMASLSGPNDRFKSSIYLIFQIDLEGEVYDDSGRLIFLCDGKRILFEKPYNKAVLPHAHRNIPGLIANGFSYKVSFDKLKAFKNSESIEFSFDGNVIKLNQKHIELFRKFFDTIEKESAKK